VMAITCANMAKVDRASCLVCLDAANKKAHFDKAGECEKCGELFKLTRNSLIRDIYYKCEIRAAMFRDVLRRKKNAYVAHNIVKATCGHVSLEFMNHFVEEVTEEERKHEAESCGKDDPRVCARISSTQSTAPYYVVSRKSRF